MRSMTSVPKDLQYYITTKGSIAADDYNVNAPMNLIGNLILYMAFSIYRYSGSRKGENMIIIILMIGSKRVEVFHIHALYYLFV